MDFKAIINKIASMDDAIDTVKSPELPKAVQLNEDAELRVLSGRTTYVAEAKKKAEEEKVDEEMKVGEKKKSSTGGTIEKTKTGVKHTAGKNYGGEAAEKEDKKKSKKDESIDVEAFKGKFAQMVEAKKKGKPDFLDIDGDGDKKEPMKKAAADKKKADGKKDAPAAKKGMTDKQAKYFGKKKDVKESVIEGDEESSLPYAERIGRALAEKGVKFSSENEGKIISMIADEMEEQGASRKTVNYYLNYDEDFLGDVMGFLPREESRMGESAEKRAPAKKQERNVELPSGAKVKATKVQGWQSQKADKEAKKVDEVSDNTKASYVKKASSDVAKMATGDKDSGKMMKRMKGVEKAQDKMKGESAVKTKKVVAESVEQKLSFRDMMKLVVESGGQQQIDPVDQELFAWASRVAKSKLGESMKAEVYAGMVYERMGGVFNMYDVLSEDQK
jgi:hypothetical protein